MEKTSEELKNEMLERNLKYTTLVYEILGYLIGFSVMVQLYNENINSVLCLSTGALLYFWLTWSLLGDRD
jgi:hypothetical protein